MNQQDKVAYLQKKVKQIGGISIATLLSVVLALISRNYVHSNVDHTLWSIMSIIAIVVASLCAILLLIIVIKLILTMFKN
ncbi:hypothetical protein [Kurthia sibirica]|uniref:Uncharacterized protein n=1 Tax=Kurthia sibirica TaxID=202750 RepID=A0A2U3AN13_9BACL|nr:hypothetical protein [Kurthia sibirica]PWI25906.1 hypothetical protein DEX24_05065 [Kurthia sibirica]GEK34258.1 hypothetical protein KSI01_17910 [Kurthia sibirica]